VRLIAFIEYAAVLAGIAAMIAGHFFGLAKGFQFGVFLVGAGIALAGFEAVATQRMGFRTSDDAYQHYAGAPALIIGLMCLLIGSAILGSAYLLAEGLWPRTEAYLARRPAPLLGAAGILIMGMGVLMTLNPRGLSGWAWRLFVYVPRFLLGVVLIVAGLAAMAGGVWEWLEPQAFQEFVQQLPRHLERIAASLRSFL
jgi:hypothetical protein